MYGDFKEEKNMETETLGTSQECQADDAKKQSSEYNSNTSEFKGSPVIGITTVDGDKRVISFGLKKAKAILSQVEAIKAFVEANDKEETTTE